MKSPFAIAIIFRGYVRVREGIPFRPMGICHGIRNSKEFLQQIPYDRPKFSETSHRYHSTFGIGLVSFLAYHDNTFCNG